MQRLFTMAAAWIVLTAGAATTAVAHGGSHEPDCNEIDICVYHPLELECTCEPAECIQLFVGQTIRTPELVFKITADRRGRYDLRREIQVSGGAPFTVSDPRFRHSFLPNNGDDCQLQTLLIAGPNNGPLARNDLDIPHSLVPDWMPEFLVGYEAVAWTSVDMRVHGVSPGTGTITVLATIDNYHF